jgi:hypothetical protein
MKPKSNSIIDNLPPNQREALERWLFEGELDAAGAQKKLSYDAAVKRLHADFNVRCSRDTVFRWYQRTAQSRKLEEIVTSRQKANLVVEKLRENPSDTYEALLGMAGQMAFEQSMTEGEAFDPEVFYNFTKLVIQGKKEARADKAEDRKTQELILAREQFEFDGAKSCLAHAPFIKSVANNKTLTEAEKIQAIRQRLWGNPPAPK